MRRAALGLIAGFLLLIGVITWSSAPKTNDRDLFVGTCISAGLVLGALWLALPQLQSMLVRAPRWVLGWFFGKGKAQSGEASAPEQPKARELRPRRRGG
jgi:hypothetical protein